MAERTTLNTERTNTNENHTMYTEREPQRDKEFSILKTERSINRDALTSRINNIIKPVNKVCKIKPKLSTTKEIKEIIPSSKISSIKSTFKKEKLETNLLKKLSYNNLKNKSITSTYNSGSININTARENNTINFPRDNTAKGLNTTRNKTLTLNNMTKSISEKETISLIFEGLRKKIADRTQVKKYSSGIMANSSSQARVNGELEKKQAINKNVPVVNKATSSTKKFITLQTDTNIPKRVVRNVRESSIIKNTSVIIKKTDYKIDVNKKKIDQLLNTYKTSSSSLNVFDFKKLHNSTKVLKK